MCRTTAFGSEVSKLGVCDSLMWSELWASFRADWKLANKWTDLLSVADWVSVYLRRDKK